MGISAQKVTIEVHCTLGVGYHLVGMADHAVSIKQLSTHKSGEPSVTIRQRVIAARLRQIKRFGGQAGLNQEKNYKKPLFCNAQMKGKHLEQYCLLKLAVLDLLEQAMKHLGLSARAYQRVINVARTIADMDQSLDISPEHMAEAVQYRVLDRAAV